jgi:hypothetical protein
MSAISGEPPETPDPAGESEKKKPWWRRYWKWIAVATVALFIGAAAGAGGESGSTSTKTDTVAKTTTDTVTTTTTATPTATTPTATATTPTTPPESPPPNPSPKAATIGTALTLSGFGGVKMSVTVTQKLDPATGGDYDEPAPGTRFVGIKLQLKNIGQKPYDDSPTNGSTLILNTNDQVDPEITVGGNCASPSSVKISPGATRNVCIPFEVPKAKNGKTFQFTLNSGFAKETGEWSVG